MHKVHAIESDDDEDVIEVLYTDDEEGLTRVTIVIVIRVIKKWLTWKKCWRWNQESALSLRKNIIGNVSRLKLKICGFLFLCVCDLVVHICCRVMLKRLNQWMRLKKIREPWGGVREALKTSVFSVCFPLQKVQMTLQFVAS